MGDIKNAVLDVENVFECDYSDENGISTIVKLYTELSNNNIQAELLEHDRITTVEFLKNLIKTYESINDETDKMIDLC